MKIETASADTRDANRDAPLSCPNFLDTQKYPAISFIGTAFNILDAATVEVSGDLMIKGVTRPVTAPNCFPWWPISARLG